MKKSTRVTLKLLTAIVMAGCTKARLSQVKRCVDQNNVEADDSRCGNQTSPLPARPAFRWVYGGTGGYEPGSQVSGVSEEPDPAMGVALASQLKAQGIDPGSATVKEDSSPGRAASERGGFGETGEHASAHGGEAGE